MNVIGAAWISQNSITVYYKAGYNSSLLRFKNESILETFKYINDLPLLFFIADQGYSRPISDTLEKVDICRKDKFRGEGERKDTLYASDDEDVQNQDDLHPVSVKPKSTLIWSEGEQDYLNPVQPELNRSKGKQDYLIPVHLELKSDINRSI